MADRQSFGSSDVQSGVQVAVQGGELSSGERELLEQPPDSHLLTLDGHCALASAEGRVVLYDVDGFGLRRVHVTDLAELDPRGWVP